MFSEETPELQILSTVPEALANRLSELGSCEVNAVLIGTDINLKGLTKRSVARKETLLIQLDDTSVAMIYSYGALVFFNATSSAIVKLINLCQKHSNQLFTTPETEQFTVIMQPDHAEGIDQNKVYIKKVSKAHLNIIGDALAKSVILESHENQMRTLFEKMQPIAQKIKDQGKIGYHINDLLKNIGTSLVLAQEMVGNIKVTEKPSVLWEHPELESLHLQLIEDLEIFERQSNLERKTELISRTSESSLDILQQYHSNRLGWYVVILIAAGMMLHIYKIMF